MLAGGMKESARSSQVVVFRQINSQMAEVKLLNLKNIRRTSDLENDLTLQPGDMVYVPPRETHVLENLSSSDPAEYVAARNSPYEDAVVVPWAESTPS